MTDERPPLTVYADYVCPFCYLGNVSLARYRESATAPPRVDWHPFDLRATRRGPDGRIDDASDDGKDDAYFEGVRENVARLADRYGVEMARLVARDVDSWDAQQVTLHVRDEREQADFEAFHDAVFAALWEADRDIGDVAVLVDVAADVGIPEPVVREAVASDALAAELRTRFDAARRRGVTGVPTFVYDGAVARGAVPPAHLERLVEG